jgi:hypothetical protein
MTFQLLLLLQVFNDKFVTVNYALKCVQCSSSIVGSVVNLHKVDIHVLIHVGIVFKR